MQGSFLCDLVLIYFIKKSHFYRNKKFEEVRSATLPPQWPTGSPVEMAPSAPGPVSAPLPWVDAFPKCLSKWNFWSCPRLQGVVAVLTGGPHAALPWGNVLGSLFGSAGVIAAWCRREPWAESGGDLQACLASASCVSWSWGLALSGSVSYCPPFAFPQWGLHTGAPAQPDSVL